ncbi:hypothetical protein, partial [Microcoleus sp. OTE_8_concoct_300]|uniref:hypothetical protein n=1 Tax=Microcoleus sp. OTE_8_concoct_300 TaxID=2964710 RepID=UPI00403F5393
HVFWLQSLVKAMFRQNTIDKTYIAEENSNSLIFLNAVFSLFQQALHKLQTVVLCYDASI